MIKYIIRYTTIQHSEPHRHSFYIGFGFVASNIYIYLFVCWLFLSEPALHALDQLLGQQTQWKLWARRNGEQRQQKVHRLVHRVPPNQQLRRGQILGRRIGELMHLCCVSFHQPHNLILFSFSKWILSFSFFCLRFLILPAAHLIFPCL